MPGAGAAGAQPGGPGRVIRTARLVLTPVGWGDVAELRALKTDPGAYGLMLGGVRRVPQVAEELAEDMNLWAAAGTGMFAVREAGVFRGIAGVHQRPDGRGVGLRFCLWPAARGRGLAREAASAALGHAHAAGLARIIAVARDSNFASRLVLGSIGMQECDGFERDGHTMVVYESVR
ncbi:MAG: GNAT family N-acetyltransferase [Janthinobacterium lividum]